MTLKERQLLELRARDGEKARGALSICEAALGAHGQLLFGHARRGSVLMTDAKAAFGFKKTKLDSTAFWRGEDYTVKLKRPKN